MKLKIDFCVQVSDTTMLKKVIELAPKRIGILAPEETKKWLVINLPRVWQI
ncbi:hypothetical protein [Segetibacter sp.]|uniref:hypothetical protein n=1 Tax=Segetibacter sp. TaxID=2231182 RepID=UPI00262285FC|nr:hypothetical protein [Segetibacter sp.]